MVEKRRSRKSGLSPPPAWIICKELIPIQRREKSTPKGPRRAFKVTCAIQFSKSVRRFRLFPQEKADAESSLVWKGSQTTSFPEVYLSGTGNIGAVPRACQPCRGMVSARSSRFATSACAARPAPPPLAGFKRKPSPTRPHDNSLTLRAGQSRGGSTTRSIASPRAPELPLPYEPEGISTRIIFLPRRNTKGPARLCR